VDAPGFAITVGIDTEAEAAWIYQCVFTDLAFASGCYNGVSVGTLIAHPTRRPSSP
jgi:hypothetical protein